MLYAYSVKEPIGELNLKRAFVCTYDTPSHTLTHSLPFTHVRAAMKNGKLAVSLQEVRHTRYGNVNSHRISDCTSMSSENDTYHIYQLGQ